MRSINIYIPTQFYFRLACRENKGEGGTAQAHYTRRCARSLMSVLCDRPGKTEQPAPLPPLSLASGQVVGGGGALQLTRDFWGLKSGLFGLHGVFKGAYTQNKWLHQWPLGGRVFTFYWWSILSAGVVVLPHCHSHCHCSLCHCHQCRGPGSSIRIRIIFQDPDPFQSYA